MNSPHFTSVNKLITDMIYPFYLLERDMGLPIRQAEENDAEHSWSLALAACALAPQIDTTLDIGKVSHFAIVHDLVEVYAGDVSVWDKNTTAREDKEANERRALDTLVTEFGDLPWIAETIKEYERKDTNEANYVWAMDKYLAMCMRHTYAKPFFTKKGITKAQFDTGIKRMSHKAHAHPGVGKLFDEIIADFDAHPEWFAQAPKA
jgi:5'-deoxynucleotidase YfbR-like HD superfamily hydrolase